MHASKEARAYWEAQSELVAHVDPESSDDDEAAGKVERRRAGEGVHPDGVRAAAELRSPPCASGYIIL